MNTGSKHVRLIAVGLCAIYFGGATLEGQVVDPGPRAGAANAGGAPPGLGADFTAVFTAARARFQEIDSVSGGVAGEAGVGLGPAFNANSCAACHAQPSVGGSSPHPTLGQVRLPNPQVAFATLDRVPGGNQVVPSFITPDGPVREARFITKSNGTRDGTVHDLYTIAGRVDAPGCVLAQPDFAGELAKNNVVFRIPTALFGLGLVENTAEETLRENLQAVQIAAAAMGIQGIHGVLNTDQEGMVTRFGWKAQGRSLQGFAGEHYNIEQGVSNEESPNERAVGTGCTFNTTPEDTANVRVNGSFTGTLSDLSSNVVNFALFMRLSAPPAPTTHTASELNGKALFTSIGCVLCHTDTLTTAASPYPGESGPYHPYSDFALHRMGSNLADGIVQGEAGPEKFRTAPLWGVGQRVFFLHDGRTTSIVEAILAHLSGGSEANAVIQSFNALTPQERQDIVNFLRSL